MKHPDSYEEFEKGILEDHRPWGRFRRFPHEGVSSIKIITVNPGGILSLQYHHGRDEFWLVLDDGLEMTVGERVWRPTAGEEIWIPKETRHRVRGVGDGPARVMELWIGPSEESDIVRLEDAYNRG
jgi:mannose-6-phosphate isomerase-like protein (cupin superfamily)